MRIKMLGADNVQDLKIYYISNSGIMLQWNGIKLIVDGLFSRDNYFNPFTQSLKKQLLDENGAYADADYLLFTHGHADHYDYSAVRDYMNQYKKTVVAAPEYVFYVGGWGFEDLMEKRILGFCDNEDGMYKLGDAELYYYRTPHLSYDLTKIGFHYSLVVKKQNESVFISGDAALNEKVLQKLRCHDSFSAAFFNPLVLQDKNMMNVFLAIQADKKFIYHLPQEENDRYYYRKSAIQAFEKNKDKTGCCRLLLNEMEEVI